MTLKNTLKKGLTNLKKRNLNEMINGWLIGDFEPSIFKTKDFEVAIKKYKKGQVEIEHYHKIATEYTIILKGKVKINALILKSDEILILEPFEKTIFEALTDTTTLVIKMPSAPNDKYI